MDFVLVTEEQLPPHVRAKLAARDRREWQQEERRRARNARRREARRRHPSAVLCGECSPSLDDWAEWADAGEIAPANRIRCARCGQ